MPLTGELVELANFSGSAMNPQGLASSGTRLFMCATTRGYEVDTTNTPWTLSAFTRMNYANADASIENQNVRAATWRNGKILVAGRTPNRVFIELHPDTGEPTVLGTIPSAVASAQAIAYNATEDRVYALDASTDALFKINVLGPDTPNTAERVGQATRFGDWNENTPRGLAWYRGKLVGVGASTKKLAIIDSTDGTAAPQGISMAAVEQTPFGLVEHAGDLILVGGQHDKIYRCRDVRWHNTIPDISIDAQDTQVLDLATVSHDATTYNFKTGYTPPNWITLSGATLTVATPAVNADTTETVELTVSRSVSGTTYSEDTEITVRVAAATVTVPVPVPDTSLKPLSYSGHPLAIRVKIHDEDVTNEIASVDDIVRGIDYPNLTEFRVGEANFLLKDINGDFSPNNPSNFFTQHGGQRTGRNSPIEIEAGFIVDGTTHTETIFKGTIIRLVQDARPATVKVVCSDNFGDMRKKTIADFGVSRHFMLTADVARSGENGVYPIMGAVMPAADGSVSLATRTGETLKPVQKLETEGTLNSRNFIVDAAGVRTEGGLILDRQVGYPQLRMKSPFRYRHIQDVITDILNHAGISDSEIEIPGQDVDPHFSSNGRINYDLLGNIGSSNPITWNGYVVDFLYDAGKWYFLYNKHRNNPNGISQVIEYDEATRTYTKLHQFAAAVEVWKFTKAGNHLYILASTGGNYDANEQSSENKIIRLDISGTPTVTDFVSETAVLQPQLAHYYAGVGSVHHKPDSRRQLIYHQNGLYYAYCDRGNSQFGIAKATAANVAPTSVVSLNIDNYENHGGLAFDIGANGVLQGATTFLSGARSQTLVFKKAL